MKRLKAFFRWLGQVWWLFTDRTAEWELPPEISPRLRAKAEAEMAERMSFGEAWTLIAPRWHYRFLRDMPCGCQRFPWKRTPTTFLLDCPEPHGLRQTLGLPADNPSHD